MSKVKIAVGPLPVLTQERVQKVRSDYLNALDKLERLLSKKEVVVFSGVDYTEFEIENLKKELDWYERFMEENKQEILLLSPSGGGRLVRFTQPYHSRTIEQRETLPAKKKKTHMEDSVRILPCLKVF